LPIWVHLSRSNRFQC